MSGRSEKDAIECVGKGSGGLDTDGGKGIFDISGYNSK